MGTINKALVELKVNDIRYLQKTLADLCIAKKELEGRITQYKKDLLDFVDLYPGDIFMIGSRVYKFKEKYAMSEYYGAEGCVDCRAFSAENRNSDGYDHSPDTIRINVLEPNYTVLKRAPQEETPKTEADE